MLLAFVENFTVSFFFPESQYSSPMCGYAHWAVSSSMFYYALFSQLWQ